MKGLLIKRATPVALAVATAAALLAPVADADAAPRWEFPISQVETGTTTAGQLALDEKRGEFYLSDNALPLNIETGAVAKSPPRVTVFNTALQRPVRSIDLGRQPSGTYDLGPLVFPMGQIPDGIALDTKNRRVITTSAHADGLSVFGMDARSPGPGHTILLPGSHPMGVVTNDAGRAWVALFSQDKVAVVDTTSPRPRILQTIDTFHPTLFARDPSRSRIYVGNNDNVEKRRNYIAVIDTRTNRVIKKIETTRNARPLVDPATGKIIVVSFISGRIVIINPDTFEVEKLATTDSTPSTLAIDAKRRLFYTTTMFRKTLLVFNADTLAPVATIRIPGEVHTLALDPRSGWLYGTQNGETTMMVVRPVRH